MAFKIRVKRGRKLKEPSEAKLRRGIFSGTQKDVLHVAKALKDTQTGTSIAPAKRYSI
jgi:hypothetical protein